MVRKLPLIHSQISKKKINKLKDSLMDFTCFIVDVLLLNIYVLMNVFFFSFFFFLQDQPKETLIYPSHIL